MEARKQSLYFYGDVLKVEVHLNCNVTTWVVLQAPT